MELQNRCVNSITQSSPQWNSRTAVLPSNVVQSTLGRHPCSPHNCSSWFPATSSSTSPSTTSLHVYRPSVSPVRMRPAVHFALSMLLSTVPLVCAGPLAPNANEVSAPRNCATAGERNGVGPGEPVSWRLICVVKQQQLWVVFFCNVLHAVAEGDRYSVQPKTCAVDTKSSLEFVIRNFAPSLVKEI